MTTESELIEEHHVEIRNYVVMYQEHKRIDKGKRKERLKALDSIVDTIDRHDLFQTGLRNTIKHMIEEERHLLSMTPRTQEQKARGVLMYTLLQIFPTGEGLSFVKFIQQVLRDYAGEKASPSTISRAKEAAQKMPNELFTPPKRKKLIKKFQIMQKNATF